MHKVSVVNLMDTGIWDCTCYVCILCSCRCGDTLLFSIPFLQEEGFLFAFDKN